MRLHLPVCDLRAALALQSMRSAMCATRGLMMGHARRCSPRPTRSRTGRTLGAQQLGSVGLLLRRAVGGHGGACRSQMRCWAP